MDNNINTNKKSKEKSSKNTNKQTKNSVDDIEALTETIINTVAEKFSQVKGLKVKYFSDKEKFAGKCKMEYETEVIEVSSQKRYRNPKPCILYLQKCFNKNFHVFVLCHELAHAITKYTEILVEDTWVHDDHDQDFYTSFSNILRFLEDKKIYELYATTKGSKYSTYNLKRYDEYSGFDGVDMGKLL